FRSAPGLLRRKRQISRLARSELGEAQRCRARWRGRETEGAQADSAQRAQRRGSGLGRLHLHRRTRGRARAGRALLLSTRPLFASLLYQASLGDEALVAELEHSCLSLAQEDRAGRRWAKEHGYKGYTSYA